MSCLSRITILCAVWLVAWKPHVCALAQMAGGESPQADRAPVAVLTVGGSQRQVELCGRQTNSVSTRTPGGPTNISLQIPIAGITAADFAMEYDEMAFNRAVMDRQWRTACALISPAVTPLIPYLDLRENNAADTALLFASCLLKAGHTYDTASDKDRERARECRLRSYHIGKILGGAPWFRDAEKAALLAVQSLLDLNLSTQAKAELTQIRDPEPGDASFGLYWLLKAEVLAGEKRFSLALDASVKSIVFESKDGDTFPTALLLSARLQEELGDFYRARDIYYEAGVLFRGTDWGAEATNRLAAIMDKGLTTAKETSAIETVFFGLDEDMNAKARAFLKGEIPGRKAPESHVDDQDNLYKTPAAAAPSDSTVAPDSGSEEPGPPPAIESEKPAQRPGVSKRGTGQPNSAAEHVNKKERNR